MKQVNDKTGCSLLLDDNYFGGIRVQLKTPVKSMYLGVINPPERKFYIDMIDCTSLGINGIKWAVSSKFIVEAKSIDKISVNGGTVSIESLRYQLLIPHGTQVKSFSELLYIHEKTKFVEFETRYKAMLYMCDIYELFFTANPDAVESSHYKLSDHELILDTKKFVDASLSTIRNMAGLKKGGEPYFLQLTKYYKSLI